MRAACSGYCVLISKWFVANNRVRWHLHTVRCTVRHAACSVFPLRFANDDDFPLDYFVWLHTARGIALAGAILIAADVPHPSDLADEGRRILFTFAGVGIAVIVMFLADRLQKHAAKAAPQAPARPAPAG